MLCLTWGCPLKNVKAKGYTKPLIKSELAKNKINNTESRINVDIPIGWNISRNLFNVFIMILFFG